MNINHYKRHTLHMPSESDGGNGSTGTSGASSEARGGSNSVGGAYHGYTTGSSENLGATEGNENGYAPGYQEDTGYQQPAFTGLTPAELTDAGLGHIQGLNSENPTQSAAEMVAAQNALGVLGYAPMVASAINPMFGMAMGLAKTAGTTGITGLAKGIGTQAVVNALSQTLGIPASVLSGLANANIGKGVSDTVTGLGTSAIASALGVPSSVVGAVGNMTGLNKAVGSNIAGAVNANMSGVNDTMAGFMGTSQPAGALTQTAQAPVGSSSNSGRHQFPYV